MIYENNTYLLPQKQENIPQKEENMALTGSCRLCFTYTEVVVSYKLTCFQCKLPCMFTNNNHQLGRRRGNNVRTINPPHLPEKYRSRCYAKSPTMQDVLQPIPRPQQVLRGDCEMGTTISCVVSYRFYGPPLSSGSV